MTCEDDANACAAEDLSAVVTSKVFLFVPDPQATLDAGYDTIIVERSKSPTGPFKQVLRVDKGITLRADTYNYVYIDEAANPTWWYRPSLVSSTNDALPALPQVVRQAIDTSFEAVITVEELRRVYLAGVNLSDDQGQPYPLELFIHYIQQAIGEVEVALDLVLLPTRIADERHDWYRRDYVNFGYVKLFKKPVVKSFPVTVSLEYPSDTKIVEFPKEWVRLDEVKGSIQIMPAKGNFTQSLVTQSGGYLPLVLGGADFLPQLWKIDYMAGFELGKLPPLLKEVVAMKAARGPLNIAGDLLGGPGVASKSVSIDGLSSSLSTTSSPENAGYSARLKRYDVDLKRIMGELQRYYNGGRITVSN